MTAINVTWTRFRDGIDSWVIEGQPEVGDSFQLAFTTEASWNEAWLALVQEDLATDKFLYGTPGLMDPLSTVSAYARSLEVAELEAERA